MTLIVVILNIFDFIPKEYKYVAIKIQKFFSTQFLVLVMAGVGIVYTDLGEFAKALMPTSLLITLFIVLGAMLGAMLVGKLVGFYLVESGIVGGLCMANRGGAGDLMVLGASERVNLISFAQISTRIGGSFMVIIASIIMNL
jgi:Na+/citrate or Na+/malate symporter